ncbi:hypothetical protein AVEN_109050-1 [Araneus ventricosus]|uniref:Uncharacterized protein n=1 Tax=Araneus ventricosus TaxID=182803 RepID=A0A4Y2U006_ARAVE|nr:hypothetical protein AVEN_83799-1 [Araneus ventricosus]GBO05371.1 hypothetical protein AVEN_222043-1 [Araneus ventricosus]GBO05541.1 hypothetical protein AVEN_109050-1 [Araneus ventricosus]
MEVLQLRGRRIPGSKPGTTEEPPPCKRAWGTSNPSGSYKPLTDVPREFREEVKAHVSSPSSDHGSKLRVPPKLALVLLQKGT